jgi:hypothetical protein
MAVALGIAEHYSPEAMPDRPPPERLASLLQTVGLVASEMTKAGATWDEDWAAWSEHQLKWRGSTYQKAYRAAVQIEVAADLLHRPENRAAFPLPTAGMSTAADLSLWVLNGARIEAAGILVRGTRVERSEIKHATAWCDLVQEITKFKTGVSIRVYPDSKAWAGDLHPFYARHPDHSDAVLLTHGPLEWGPDKAAESLIPTKTTELDAWQFQKRRRRK